MKRTSLCAVLLFISLKYLSAQTLHLNGSVLDADGKPVPYATVTVSLDPGFVKGAVTDSNGVYKVGGLNPGTYVLKASFMGHTSIEQTVSIQNPVTVATLRFSQKSTELNEVTVSGRMPAIRRETDRFLVDLQHTIIARNKNALQALNYSPGVIVGKNNIITLNGKDNVVVMLNGRKMNMTQSDVSSFLSSLRGEDIQRIEVISSPGAQYDADGQGGVIDIYLKRSALQGFSGSFYTVQDQAYYLSPSVGTNLNWNVNKWTLYGSVGYRGANDLRKSEELISYPATYDRQLSFHRNESHGDVVNYRGGVQLAISPRHSLGLEAFGNINNHNSDVYSSVLVLSADADSTLDLDIGRSTEKSSASYSLNYRFNIRPGARTLTLISDYTRVANLPLSHYHYKGSSTYEAQMQQSSESRYNIFSTQLDYADQLTKSLKFSVGTKYSLLNSDISEWLNSRTGSSWQADPRYTFSYDYREHLLAAYMNMNYKSKRLEGNVGLRTEYNEQQASLFSRDHIGLFPSAVLKYNASDKIYFSANYGRRVNRPPYRSILPYYSFSSLFFIQQGNPQLQPSMVHALGFTTGYTAFSLSLNYDRIQDNIYYLSQYDPATGIRYGRNSNIERGRVFSASLTLPFTITKWWDTFSNVLYRYKRFEDPAHLLFSKNNMFMFRSSHSFVLPWDINMELTATGMSSPLAGPMIEQQGGSMFDAGVSRDFYRKKLHLAITMEDITGLLNNFREKTFYNGYIGENTDFQNSRVLSVSLTYYFKKGKDFKVDGNKNSNQNEQSRTEEK